MAQAQQKTASGDDASSTQTDERRWEDACRAAALLAIDPAGLKGIVCNAWPGPVRELWRALVEEFFDRKPRRRIPVSVTEDRLIGGLDLAATLASGQPVLSRGLLAEADGGLISIAMGERMAPAIAAQIGQVLDHHQIRVERDGLTDQRACSIAVILEDESLADEDPAPEALRDRLAFWVNLDGLRVSQLTPSPIEAADIGAAHQAVDHIAVSDDVLNAICKLAQAMGIATMRGPLLALRAARAHAALEARDQITAQDLAFATRLVLLPRARQLPQFLPPQDEIPPPEPPSPDDSADNEQEAPEKTSHDGALEDQVLAAVAANLPPDMLASLIAGHGRKAGGRRGGKAAMVKANKGRPAGVRHGPPGPKERLDVLATLRAAAPWQTVRRRARSARDDRVIISGDDWRTRRRRQRALSTTIFVVDASGSSAINRLAEVKGAIEMILADCYIRRDQVALVAFRGRQGQAPAQVIVPPTASLARAKKCLSALPAGGGTPLASGLDVAYQLTDSVMRQGSRPLVVLLSDGGANITLDGQADRTMARENALDLARRFKRLGVASLVVDTSPRGRSRASDIAHAMGARHIPLPQATAQSLSAVVSARTVLEG